MPVRSKADALSLLVDRTRSTLQGLASDEFPYIADPETGEWVTTADGNWCGGHWIGMCWIAAQLTGESRFEETARKATATIRQRMPRDNMFFGMNSQYAGFRAFDITGDPHHREIGLEGANAVVEYFNERARQVPLGTLAIEAPASNFRGPDSDDSPSGDQLGAVDAVYTALPVLWRAYAETKDPTYRDIAVSHTDRHLDWYVRPDGRTWHHAEFDPETGSLRQQYNELAESDDTCWARGQGWCIAGLARAYRETGADRYQYALRHTVDYYVDHSPDDLVPHWDFEHPDKPDLERDTSAAALTAYGLTSLSDNGPLEDLADIGEEILESLIQGYLTPREDGSLERPDGMVLESCYNGPAGYATANEHVWTDYYLMYTLYRD